MDICGEPKYPSAVRESRRKKGKFPFLVGEKETRGVACNGHKGQGGKQNKNE